MELKYNREQLQACVDYVNRHNPVFQKIDPLDIEDVLEVAIDLIDHYALSAHYGILFQYKEIGEDILMVSWVLPFYFEDMETVHFDSVNIDHKLGEALENLEGFFSEVSEYLNLPTTEESDLDPRLTSLKVPNNKKDWN